MSTNVGEGARKLGEKLLAEVEVEDLSSVLNSLRDCQVETRQSNEPTSNTFFGVPDLDALFPHPTPAILELVSPPAAHHPSGAGKTSLLYLIIAHAILPPSIFPSIPLDNQDAAVILFDPLHHFSVPRLAEVMLNLLITKISETTKELDDVTKTHITSLVSKSLSHIHIFRPQSWTSLISTLRSLPDYLFDPSRHKSMHRRVHSIILEDIDAFAWSIRSAAPSSNSLAAASTLLSNSLQCLTKLLSCIIILSSQSSTPNSFRPAMPTSWPQDIVATRLAVRRVEVLKFAPAISAEEAEVERAQRWEVVKRVRVRFWKVGARVQDGEGFVFSVENGRVQGDWRERK